MCNVKIVLINASDKGGGAEESVISLHRALLAAGHASTVYVGTKKTDEPGVVQIPYVRGLPGFRRIARWMENQTGWQDIYNPSFRNLSQHVAPDTDIIHFNNLWGANGFADIGILPQLTAKILGIFTERQNWSFTGHCAYFHDCMKWKTGCGGCPRLDLAPAIPKDGTRFNWKRKRRIVQKSNLTFVGISDYVCDLARQSPVWEGKRVTRIYNGINTDVFTPVGKARKNVLRNKFSIPDDKVAVFLSGQTLGGYREGIATEGYQALNILCDPKIIPVLVGRKAQEASRQLKVPSVAVNYRETPESMAECYQACDITLVTSKVEAFGRIGAESQACGTPVVALATGGIPEVVRDGKTGFLLSQGDVEGLIRCLQTLAHDSALRIRMGDAARDLVQKTFSNDMIADEYVKLYSQIISQGQYT